jgi:hypothetical protein
LSKAAFAGLPGIDACVDQDNSAFQATGAGEFSLHSPTNVGV